MVDGVEEHAKIEGDVVEVSNPPPLVWRLEQNDEKRDGRVGGWFIVETSGGRVRVDLPTTARFVGEQRDQEGPLGELCAKLGIEADFGVPFESASASLLSLDVGKRVAVHGRATRLAFDDGGSMREAPTAQVSAIEAAFVASGKDAHEKLHADLQARERAAAPPSEVVAPPPSIANPLRFSLRQLRATIPLALLGLCLGLRGSFDSDPVMRHSALALAVMPLTAALLWRPRWPLPHWFLGVRAKHEQYMHPRDHVQRRGQDRWFAARMTFSIGCGVVFICVAFRAAAGDFTVTAIAALVVIALAASIGLGRQNSTYFAGAVLGAERVVGTVVDGATMTITHHVSPAKNDVGEVTGYGITMLSGTLTIGASIRLAIDGKQVDVPAREVVWGTSNADEKPRSYRGTFDRSFRLQAGDPVIAVGRRDTPESLRAKGERPVVILGTGPEGDPLAYARAVRRDGWIELGCYLLAAVAVVLSQRL